MSQMQHSDKKILKYLYIKYIDILFEIEKDKIAYPFQDKRANLKTIKVHGFIQKQTTLSKTVVIFGNVNQKL